MSRAFLRAYDELLADSHLGKLPRDEARAERQCQAAAKGSALAGFLPIEGGIPWPQAIPAGAEFGLTGPFEYRITYNPFVPVRPFKRPQDPDGKVQL